MAPPAHGVDNALWCGQFLTPGDNGFQAAVDRDVDIHLYGRHHTSWRLKTEENVLYKCEENMQSHYGQRVWIYTTRASIFVVGGGAKLWAAKKIGKKHVAYVPLCTNVDKSVSSI